MPPHVTELVQLESFSPWGSRSGCQGPRDWCGVADKLEDPDYVPETEPMPGIVHAVLDEEGIPV